MKFDANFFIIIFSMFANLVTIIRFTSALEKRLTSLETVIEKVLEPQLAKVQAQTDILFSKLSENIRKEDLQEIFERKQDGRRCTTP